MAVKIGSARIDERGKAKGGKAGDQTGKEVSTQDWYLHSKGWILIRAKDPAKARIIAATMKAACANPLIGYDQGQRDTLWNALKNKNFDLNQLDKAVETDCSALVRFCCAAAGIMASNFTTGTQVSHLKATGEFYILTDSKYTTKSTYLRVGDILVTKTSGHTVVVLTDGPKAYEGDVPLGTRPLESGAWGTDVEDLQMKLAMLGCDPKGIDGEFGPNTEKAVKSAQKALGLSVTGKADIATIAAIQAAVAAKDEPDEPDAEPEPGWRVTASELNIRTGPSTDYGIVGTVKKGTLLEPVKPDGWAPVVYGGQARWASEKYLEEAK